MTIAITSDAQKRYSSFKIEVADSLTLLWNQLKAQEITELEYQQRLDDIQTSIYTYGNAIEDEAVLASVQKFTSSAIFRKIFNRNIIGSSGSYLADLEDVGPSKPIGDLPYRTLMNIYGNSEKIQNYLLKLRSRGLKVFRSNAYQNHIVCYDPKALENLLRSYNLQSLTVTGESIVSWWDGERIRPGSKHESIQFENCPPDYFANFVSSFIICDHLEMQTLIADAFGDYFAQVRIAPNAEKFLQAWE